MLADVAALGNVENFLNRSRSAPGSGLSTEYFRLGACPSESLTKDLSGEGRVLKWITFPPGRPPKNAVVAIQRPFCGSGYPWFHPACELPIDERGFFFPASQGTAR